MRRRNECGGEMNVSDTVSRAIPEIHQFECLQGYHLTPVGINYIRNERVTRSYD